MGDTHAGRRSSPSPFEKWFPYRKETGGFEFFAFPHAGAGSTVFNSLRDALAADETTLTPAVLRGRGRRVNEEPHQSMDALLAEFEEMARRDGYAAFQGEYGLLGHCFGAIVAYEIARLLVRAPCADPRLLVVCSCVPPDAIRDTGMSRLPTPELLAETAAMGGMPADLLDNPDFLEMLEPPLRGDWTICDRYVHEATSKVSVPILAVRGSGDPYVRAEDLSGWQDHTSEELVTADLEAAHLVLAEENSSALAREVTAALSAIRSPRSQAR